MQKFVILNKKYKSTIKTIVVPTKNPRLNLLTVRERQISEFVAQGLTNYAIARNFGLAEVTKKKHCKNIYEKLNVQNRSSLTKLITEKRSSRNN